MNANARRCAAQAFRAVAFAVAIGMTAATAATAATTAAAANPAAAAAPGGMPAATAVPAASGNQDQAGHYTGIAYGADDGKPVYREEHWVYRDGGAWHRLVLYRCAQGPAFVPFARKQVTVTPGAGPYAPDFDLFDARSGYREGVRERDGGRQVYVQENASAVLKAAALPARSGAVIDAGFDDFVRGHWDALAGKGDLTVPFLVPSRLAYLQLKLGGGAAVRVDGREALRLRMKLDAWYGFAAPTLEIFYSVPGRRLVRFQGIGNIRDEAGNSQSVRIDFPEDMRFAAATRQDIERAAALPLARHCP